MRSTGWQPRPNLLTLLIWFLEDLRGSPRRVLQVWRDSRNAWDWLHTPRGIVEHGTPTWGGSER